jgi:aspartyl-tRNA(Asn)/glutamyl-tRNA(Gln) amidotransferase subunit A
MMPVRATLARLAADLASGKTTSVALTEACWQRIEEPSGEGARTFIRRYREQALTAASASDQLRARGVVASPLAGIPLSVKDLFDVAGEPTTAGSTIVVGVPPAPRDAAIVRRLRAAGAVIVGTTNMTEAAYSALGMNPHYGTPKNPIDAARIPGGSSSGAAVSVSHGFCAAAIGTDTAGSVRIPAALCGLTGLKPTQARIPRDGVFPLSDSLDSVGPIGVSVACCALLDATMAARELPAITALPVQGLRLAVPTQYLTEGLDAQVSGAFARALDCLSAAGARVSAQAFATFEAAAVLESAGKLLAAEAFAVHRARLAEYRDRYDPRVRARLEDAAALSAADYLAARRSRAHAIEVFGRESMPFDALLAPTVPIVAPRFQELDSDADYRRINALVRRNTAVVNVLDRCALSLPCQAPGALPVGLMVVVEHAQDERLHAIGAAIERTLREAGLGEV